MKKSRGFTLAELLIGMLILSMTVAGALSFFIFQGRRASESFRDKNTGERVFAALSMIGYDIQRAGFGAAMYPKIAICIVTTGNGDRLYLSYSDYLDVHERDASLPVLRRNCIWAESTYTSQYQGFFRMTGMISQLKLLGIPKRQGASMNDAVGAVLADPNPKSPTLAPIYANVNVKASSGTDNLSVEGTQDWTFPLETTLNVPADSVVVPAISYSLATYTVPELVYGVTKNVQYKSLWRNRGSEANPNGQPLLGWDPVNNTGDRFLNIVDFKVRRQYVSGKWDTSTVTELREPSPDPGNVRFVEVALTYSINKGTGSVYTWSTPITRTIRISPRNVVLFATM